MQDAYTYLARPSHLCQYTLDSQLRHLQRGRHARQPDHALQSLSRRGDWRTVGVCYWVWLSRAV